MQSRPTWDNIFMDFCKILSERSTCARLKTAAIIVKNKNVISIGYNGTCSHMEHCVDYWKGSVPEEQWEQFLNSKYFYDEHHKYSNNNELHAEMNAITNAAKNNCSSFGATMYSVFSPCIGCSKLIISSGIEKVIYLNDYERDVAGINFLRENGAIVEKLWIWSNTA